MQNLVEEWTIEDVCTFVQGLSLEFGDQASVYAAAMKEKAIDGKALLDLSAANPIADNKLKELGLTTMGRRATSMTARTWKLLTPDKQSLNTLPRTSARLSSRVDVTNLVRTRSTAKALAQRCSSPRT